MTAAQQCLCLPMTYTARDNRGYLILNCLFDAVHIRCDRVYESVRLDLFWKLESDVDNVDNSDGGEVTYR